MLGYSASHLNSTIELASNDKITLTLRVNVLRETAVFKKEL